MSVSRIRDSEAERFSWVTDRFAIVCSSRFWAAPNRPRWVETALMAESSEVIAADAVASDRPLIVSELAPMPEIDTLSVSPELAPTWKERLVEPESSDEPLNLVRD